VSEVILKPEGAKGEDVSEAFGEGQQEVGRRTDDDRCCYRRFHVDERGCCQTHREGSR
jgi:hypothetical protein